jgi:hypothetical protein
MIIGPLLIFESNTGSRRLLTYRRLPDNEIDRSLLIPKREYSAGIHADELNDFRRKVRLSRLLSLSPTTATANSVLRAN